MKTVITPPRGMFLGAALMYFLDPQRGRRRRAAVVDKGLKLRRRARRAAVVATRDLENRIRGRLTELASRFSVSESDDARLEARVRASFGRVCSHSRAIEVHAHNGAVTVAGPVLLSEWRRVRNAIRGTRGVEEVDDRLEIHTVADIPRLLGGVERASTPLETLKGNWSPATRLVIASVGTLGAIAGLTRRGIARPIITGLGLYLVGNAVIREIRTHQHMSATVSGINEPPRQLDYEDMMESTGDFEYIS